MEDQLSTRFVNLEYRLKFWMQHPIPGHQRDGLQECLNDLRNIKETVLRGNSEIPDEFWDLWKGFVKEKADKTKEPEKRVGFFEYQEKTDKKSHITLSHDDRLSDSVDHPSHYQGTGLEVIEVLEAFLSEEQMIGFLIGNILKYLLRAYHKHESPVEDFKKTRWYLDYLISRLEKEQL